MGKNNNSTELKSNILGMKFGTAASRLRKEIMFRLVRDLGKDICLRCGKKIETIKEFSIDHIIARQRHENPVEMFFDINNIAFSHLRCNIADGGGHNKITPPFGKSWCHSCKVFLPEEEFHKRGTEWNGLNEECVSCKSERMREYNER